MKTHIVALSMALLLFNCNSTKTQTDSKPDSSHATAQNHDGNNYPMKRESPIQPEFIELPIGDVTPKGWLLDWTMDARNGIGGVESNYFKASWVYGKVNNVFDNENRGYVNDGLIKLGLILKDEEILGRTKEVMKEAFEHRFFTDLQPDDNINNWGTYCYMRGLLSYYESTGDETVRTAMEDALFNVLEMYHDDAEWHQRARPLLLSQIMLELYKHGGDEKLLERGLAALDLSNEKAGWSKRFYKHWHDSYNPVWEHPFKNARGGEPANTMHAVTYNEMSKLWAVHYLWNENPEFLKVSENAFDFIQKHDGVQTYGCMTAQENVLGVGATVGTETCNFIDYAHSSHTMLSVTGKGKYADMAEKAFYNGGASSVSRDFKTHVYLQYPNKLEAKGRFEYIKAHGPRCCHSNIARMLPTFISSMWMASQDKGAVLVHYAPSEAKMKVGNQKDAVFTVTGNYPFKNKVQVSVAINQPEAFPFYFRIPEWGTNASVTINGEAFKIKEVNDGFAKINRTWKNGDKIAIVLPMDIKLHHGVTHSNGGNISIMGKKDELTPAGKKARFKYSKFKEDLPYTYVTRGPLTYVLPLEENANYNYALSVSEDYKVVEGDMPNKWNWPLDAPVKIVAKASSFAWDNFPELPADRPSNLESNKEIELIPLGCSKGKRVSMFPSY